MAELGLEPVVMISRPVEVLSLRCSFHFLDGLQETQIEANGAELGSQFLTISP